MRLLRHEKRCVFQQRPFSVQRIELTHSECILTSIDLNDHGTRKAAYLALKATSKKKLLGYLQNQPVYLGFEDSDIFTA